jgi:hypothetical protein
LPESRKIPDRVWISGMFSGQTVPLSIKEQSPRMWAAALSKWREIATKDHLIGPMELLDGAQGTLYWQIGFWRVMPLFRRSFILVWLSSVILII